MFKKAALSAIALMAIASAANAQAISTVNATVTPTNAGPNNTNFSGSFSISQFDATLGTLLDVTFTLGGTTNSTFTAENVSTTATSTISTASAQVVITLTAPDTSTLVVTTPSVSFAPPTISLSAFDGTFDNAGTSGRTANGASSDSDALTTASQNATFTGNGSVVTPFTANDSNALVASGGILAAGFTNNAAASLTVVFRFQQAAPPPPTGGVPEPSAVAFAAIAGAGLLGMMVRARRK